MPTDKLIGALAIAVAFTCGFLVGKYREEPSTPTLPANWDPGRSDALATVRAQQESLTKCYAAITEMAAKNASH